MRSTRTSLVRSIVRACVKGGVAILSLLGGAQIGFSDSAIAEIIPTANETLTEITVSTPDQLDISGGQPSSDGHNLFHSFDRFDLEAGQTANFITVPDVQNVLSQIHGPASSIDGLLQITGSHANLYLINPSGILFGPNAQINLPGNLTATTATSLSFGDQLFSVTAGISAEQPIDYGAFFGNPTAFVFGTAGTTAGALVNLGHLAVAPGQNITLMGGTLLNTGSLSAPGGKLTLIAVEAGNLVRIGAPNQLLSLEVSPTDAAALAPQTLAPQTLSEILTGSGLDYADTLVVEANGAVRLARSGIEVTGGQAIASGTLSAANPDGIGGEINLLGSQVGVINTAISASGKTGGGTLRIGGDYLGGGPNAPTAQQTYVGPQSTLTADALASGNGGQIYIWSNEATQFYGHLSAQGGSLFGNGGFAEISGKQALSYRGTLNLDAPQGTLGNVLFDPFNIIIKDGSSGGLPLPSPFIFNQISAIDVTFYEKDLEQLSNVTLLAMHDIIIEDLTDGALSFVSPSNVTFRVDTNRSFGGSFIMQDTSDTIQTAGGNLQIISDGPLGDLFNSNITLGNIDTRAIGPSSTDGSITLQSADSITALELNAGNSIIQLLGNSISLAGGNQSVTANTVTLAPLSPDRNIRLGSATNDDLANALDLSITDLSAISRTTGQVNIGSAAGTGTLTFLSDIPTVNDSAPIRLLGSESATLVGPNANTLWTITGQNSGTLSSLPSSAASAVSFSGIGNLVGGDQDDTFNFEALSAQVTQTIRGGAGRLVFTGQDIDLAAAVSGKGTLSIFPDAMDTVTVGGADQPNQFNVSDRELTAIQAGFNAIEIGSNRSSLAQGNIPVITQAAESPAEIVAPIVSENNGRSSGPNVVLTDSGSAQSAEIFSQIETTLGAQFEDYLSRSGGGQPTKVATLAQVQDTLKSIQQQKPQVRSALVYVYFVPSADSEESVQLSRDRAPQPDDQLEVMLINADGAPIRKRQWGVTRAEVEATAIEFRHQATSQFSKPAQYLPPAQKLYQWLIAPIEPHLSERDINNLAMIMDDGLRTLPLAALHDGQQFLIEKYSIGLVPTFSLTNFGLQEREGGLQEQESVALEADRARSSQQVLAMGASRFANQPALPAVEAELSLISERLGNAFLNENFTLENLKTQVASQHYSTVHLATHATFAAGDREGAYIQLWNQRMGLSELESINFGANNIELIILSACSTAMGDRNSEYGFAGFAVNAGSESAMASLWPVNDEGTLGFMTQFYEHLPTAVTRSEALRQAQIALLSGDIGISNGQLYDADDNILAVLPELEQSGSWDFSHPFYWSAFTMIGSPW